MNVSEWIRKGPYPRLLVMSVVVAYILVGCASGNDAADPDSGWVVQLIAGNGTLLDGKVDAEPGFKDGRASEASFDRPLGLAVDSEGNVFIADSGNHRIRKLTREGQVETVAGSGDEGTLDGPALEASFRTPVDVSIGPDGALYVADAEAGQIRRIADGEVRTVAGIDVVGCRDALARRKTDPAAPIPEGCPEAAGQATYRDGPALTALFNQPSSVAAARDGTLFVADSSNQVIRTIDPAGNVATYAGQQGRPGTADGSLTEAQFFFPVDLEIDEDGSLWFTEGSRLRMVEGDQIITVAGSREEGMAAAGFADGPARSARFNSVSGIALLPGGSIVLADAGNQRIRLVSAGRDVSTIAGRGGQGMELGAGEVAQFSLPSGIGLLPDGSLVMSDHNLNRIFRIERSSAK